ncbi:TetR/AcrR family transcriptional regulator [Rubritepida flocculans]|uniref:TetR/AcrR family transcriptional regulator n=1 Tax=Rubritepida flocculans TaxID=182403 RepID=UPI00041EC57F|nr:TetR/AcrR family transcriptional regulator [Rubritepida flocculans]
MPDGSSPAAEPRPRGPEAADARTRILDAAERIVQARGVPALTLEAAAREAGVSKGGLLYHFASKEALLAGLLNRLADHVEAEFLAVLEAEPPHPARATRAVLAWIFDHPEAACENHQRAAAVFLAAFHHDPALLDPIRAVFRRIRDRLRQDALPPGHALAVMAAGDGLFMARVFGMYAPEAEEMAALRAALSRLAEMPA